MTTPSNPYTYVQWLTNDQLAFIDGEIRNYESQRYQHAILAAEARAVAETITDAALRPQYDQAVTAHEGSVAEADARLSVLLPERERLMAQTPTT